MLFMGSFFFKNLQQNSMLDDIFRLEIMRTWDRELSLNVSSNIELATGDISRSVCSNPCDGGKEPIPKIVSQCFGKLSE